MQNQDGSFAVLSNEKIHQHSKKDFEIKSDQNMVVEIKKDETHNESAATTSTRRPATATSRPSSTRRGRLEHDRQGRLGHRRGLAHP